MALVRLRAMKSSMTYAEAKARLPQRRLPPFWIGNVTDFSSRLSALRMATVTVIAQTPGGRPLYLVAYGTRENQPSKANFNSAIGAQDPSAYRNKAARHKPVVLLVGPVHGQEVEGLTGLVNLIQVMETGRDLRDQDQSILQAWGQRCRLLIIPSGNPDGTARFEPRALQGLAEIDLVFWGQGTWIDNTCCGWPQCKSQHPMLGANVGFLGCYFNDQGVNPMHDEFVDPLSTEAPAILKVAKAEAPDLAVSLHSHESRPDVLRPAYVPLEVQENVRRFAERFYTQLDRRGLPHAGLFTAQPERGLHPEPFNLSSAIYHVSGADSFTFECPHGLTDAAACHVDLDQILDIQLTFYQAMFRFAVEQARSEAM